MRSIIFLLICTSCFNLAAQNPFKQLTASPKVDPKPIQISRDLTTTGQNRFLGNWSPSTLNSVHSKHESIKSFRITTSGSMWIELHPNDLWSNRSSHKDVIGQIIPALQHELPVEFDWQVVSENTDAQQKNHIRVQQTLGGKPIYGQDLILHLDRGVLEYVNGFAWTGKVPQKLPAPVPSSEVLEVAKQYLLSQNVKFQPKADLLGVKIPADEASLIWMPQNGNLVLSYEVNIHPNPLDHWTVYVNASTTEIIKAISQKCAISPHKLFEKTTMAGDCTGDSKMNDADYVVSEMTASAMDGATVTNDQDLLGQSQTVNGYQVGATYFMIDASRTGMYRDDQSVMPDEPVGVIWTIDAQNASPQQSNFEVFHITTNNNDWENLEVSAHYNAGQAYEYFLSKFNRNAINGSGGNIISIINVTDENDNDMDNAFWGGAAMFYGNGDSAFKPLARGLDVAGHEMSHGVIQNTANLEYIGQSGALNESYADVFGSMIDRNDWQIGEDVVNLSAFPSGALRDLSNPNNGGSQLGHPGWQPKHMNEFVNLPVTPESDNGGVHINSGIPNKAFFLLASSVGKEKAEQIYYKALTDYLVKSSQFIDMRNAAEKAAGDLHGTGSAEVVAVRTAFDGVGIGTGQGGDYEDDIEVNEGDDFVLATDEFESDLYLIPVDNPAQYVELDVPAPISRPSFTDDGSACVYVDEDHNMVVINFDWTQGLDYQWGFLEDNPQGGWQNIVVSKDGSKIAYTSSDLVNAIFIYDFNSGANEAFELFNPTSADGGFTTGDVLYPDALEWDYSGEYVMYDALNRIESNFGDGIEYWDISFLYAWDNAANSFGSGLIGKLFSALPENISVGNPSFSKNSPYIITFDFVETYYDFFGVLQVDYRIKAANIEAGEVNDIYINNTVGWPSYSRLDDKILFTYDDFGTPLLATIDIQSDNKTLPVLGTELGFFGGMQKGVWFSNGERIFSKTNEIDDRHNALHLWPQPVVDYVTVSGDGLGEDENYSIWDLTGRSVLDGELGADKTIEVKNLIPGTYFLQTRTDHGTIRNARFIKQ